MSGPYSPASRLLEQIWETKKSIKTLAYDNNTGALKVSKSTYAQVCHVLEHQKVLAKLIAAIPISCRNEALLYVLIYELLLGPNKKIRGGGALKRSIMKKEEQLRDVLTSLKGTYKETAERVVFPRYVRVNTLKCTLQEAVDELNKEDSFSPFYIDKHVPNLLVLQPNAAIHNHEWVKNGKFILQDKSSCFSALCLVQGNNNALLRGNCLDACAAPGNKTSHLAAALPFGKVIACDRNEKRLTMLDRRMKLLVTNNGRVKTKHVDYLSIKAEDYTNIKGILLDPSCSGSGMFTSLDRMGDDEENEEEASDRIEHLSNFQLTALKHSMTFASVERIVYSTCSLNKEENEMVVQQALEVHDDDWQLVAPHCLREWKRRGQLVEGMTKEQAKCMVRADRGDDTNGFFVAYFERKGIDFEPHADDSSNSGEVVVPEGLSLYDGNFVTKNGTHAKVTKKADVNTVFAKEGNAGKDASKNNTPSKNPKKGKEGKSPKGAKSPKNSKDSKSSKGGKDTKNQSSPDDDDAKPKKWQPPKSLSAADKSDKMVAKKKAKKLAWKQRQIDQKKERLLSKEGKVAEKAE